MKSLQQSFDKPVHSLFTRLTRSQFAMGLTVAVTVIAALGLWENWSRAPLAAAGLGAMLVLAAMYVEPVIGVMAAAFLVSSNLSMFLRGGLSAVLLVTALILIIKKLMNNDPTWTITRFTKWSLLFIVWQQFSGLWASNYDNYDWANFYRVFLIVLVIAEAVKTPRHFLWVVIAVGAGLAVSGISTIQSAAEFYASGTARELSGMVSNVQGSRFFGTWYEPNAMALALVPFIGLTVAVIRTRFFLPLRLLGLGCAILGLIAVVLSLSRGGMLCLALLLIVIISAEKYRVLISAMVAAVLLFILATVPTDIFGRLESLGEGGGDSSISQRLELISAGSEIIQKSFPFGVGLGNFQTYSIDYADELPHGMIAHNAVIDVTADLGIVGILLFLSVFFSLFKTLRWSGRRMRADDFASNLNVCLGASLFAICLGMMFYSASGFAYFWFVMTLISIYPKVFPDAARE